MLESEDILASSFYPGKSNHAAEWSLRPHQHEDKNGEKRLNAIMEA